MQANAPVGIIGLGLIGTALSGRLIDADVPIGFDIKPGASLGPRRHGCNSVAARRPVPNDHCCGLWANRSKLFAIENTRALRGPS